MRASCYYAESFSKHANSPGIESLAITPGHSNTHNKSPGIESLTITPGHFSTRQITGR
ncbi:MAG: hypothetical protein IJP89_05435 [Synergistaceae bacterium]|nr:hypothetical protein [Synergistaceae bacterium]